MQKTDFPIFRNYPELVYLDNAATSQKPQAVIDAVKDFYENKNSNVHRGIHSLAERATLEFENARNNIAQFIGADPIEVIFTSGTTESINLIAQMLFEHYENTNEKKTILLSEMEHHSNILPWQLLAGRLGWELEYVRLTSEYELDLEDLIDKIKKRDVSILSLTHMSNVLGTINNLDEIFSKVKNISPRTFCIGDGAQYIPHHKFDLTKNNNIDFYVFSGHKIMGPTGIGILYGKKKLLETLNPSKVGGGMISKVERNSFSTSELPEKFEAGTPNIAGAIGLSAVINYFSELNESKVENHMSELTNFTLNELNNIDELTLYGPQNLIKRGPVFSFSIDGIHPHDISQILDQDGIAIRAGHHCCQILHREILKIPASARVSLYLYNDIEEIKKLSISIKKLITQFKR
ncbi:SufS family cysteine desulfurase [Candidatus Dojkabacteria bacterium]|uniref:Cysteine desulfurase n=1 Tax=Candidatus Dojkabacteria bacterium TaxID=2099670 RepID=A0A955L1D9_9BACT|nr:SufS family cysteine desulfurase [Candidatus Dojkabacteria bacterium]